MPIPFDSLLAFLLASAALAVAPGPDNLFVLAQSALYGARAGVLVTLGLCTGLIAHTAAVTLGVAALIQTSPAAFTTLKVVGAGYLAYLAWRTLSAPASAPDGPRATVRSGWALYRRGIIMNVTNPKVSIFFLAFLPQFADPANGPLTPQILLLGALFGAVALLVFSGIALAAARLGDRLARSPRAQTALNRIAGLIFAALAIRLVTSGM